MKDCKDSVCQQGNATGAREYALTTFKKKIWEHRGYKIRLLRDEKDVQAVMAVYDACSPEDRRLRFVAACSEPMLQQDESRIRDEYITLVYERDGMIVGAAFLNVLLDPTHAEFAYVTHPNHRRNELATRATQILCTICQLIGVRYVHLDTCAANRPMHIVARRLGMVRQKTDPQEVNFILDLAA